MIAKFLGRLLGRDKPHPNFYHEMFVRCSADKFGRYAWLARIYARAGSGPIKIIEGFAPSYADGTKAAHSVATLEVKTREAAWR